MPDPSPDQAIAVPAPILRAAIADLGYSARVLLGDARPSRFEETLGRLLACLPAAERARIPAEEVPPWMR